MKVTFFIFCDNSVATSMYKNNIVL